MCISISREISGESDFDQFPRCTANRFLTLVVSCCKVVVFLRSDIQIVYDALMNHSKFNKKSVYFP